MARPSDTTLAQPPRSGLKIAASCIAVCLALTAALLLVVSNSKLDDARIPANGRESEITAIGRQPAPAVSNATTVDVGPSIGRQRTSETDRPGSAEITFEQAVTGVQTVSVAGTQHAADTADSESLTTEQAAAAWEFPVPDAEETLRSPNDDQHAFHTDTAVPSASHRTDDFACDSPVEVSEGAALFLADAIGPAVFAEEESSSESEAWQWRPLDETQAEVQQPVESTDVLPIDGLSESRAPATTAVDVASPASVLRSDVAAKQKIVRAAVEKKVEPFVVPESADRRIRFFSGRSDRQQDGAHSADQIRNQNSDGINLPAAPASQSNRQASLTLESGSSPMRFASGERDTRLPLPMPESRNSGHDESDDHVMRSDQQTSQSAPHIVIHNHINGQAASAIPQQPVLPDPRIAQLQRQIEELAQAVQRVTEPELRKEEPSASLEQQRTTIAVDANTAALREMQQFLAELRVSLRESQMSASETSRRLAAEVSEFTHAVDELQQHVTAPRFAARPEHPIPDQPQTTHKTTADEHVDRVTRQARSTLPPAATFAGAPRIRPRNSGPVSTRSFSGNAAGSGIRMEPLPEFEPIHAPTRRAATIENQSSVDMQATRPSLYPPVDRPGTVRATTTPMPADPSPPKVDWPSSATIPVPLPKTLEIETPVKPPETRQIPAAPAPGTSALRVPSDQAAQKSQIPLPYPPSRFSPDAQPAATGSSSATPLQESQSTSHDATSASETHDGTENLTGAIHAYVFDPPPAAQPARPRMTSSVATLKTQPLARPVATTRITSAPQRSESAADEYTAHPTSGRVKLSSTLPVPPESLPALQGMQSNTQSQTNLQAIRSNSQPGFLTRTRVRFGDLTDSITDVGPAWTDGITRRPSEWEWPRRVADGVSDISEGTAERFGRARSKSAASGSSRTVHRTGAVFRYAFQPNSATR